MFFSLVFLPKEHPIYVGVGGSDGIPRDPRESINLDEGRTLIPLVASAPKTLTRESMRIEREPSALCYVFKQTGNLLPYISMVNPLI